MNNFALPMIMYFIFTIDNDFEEKCLDLVKDFTALLILVDLDNMMSYEDPVPNYNIMEVLQVKGFKKGNLTNLPKYFNKAVKF